ncbi:MAG: biopolymer transporter ExbD [Bacteroidota bacterium]|nr:biopolymer transporter ExbD [Bacteroidota bacterium]
MAKKNPEFNASSMADIAFLLLIFFLVTTTMDVDMGIVRKLPPPPDPSVKPPDINERNIFQILVNKNDKLLVNGKPGNLRDIQTQVRDFILNPYNRANLSEKRTEKISYLGEVNISKGIISLKNDRGTSYNMYIKVQNELAAAFKSMRNDLSQEKLGMKYDDLSKKEFLDAINKTIPIAISEAEPENVGD